MNPIKKQIINDTTFNALNDYFSHHKKTFDIRIKFEKGTEFQKEVWAELLKIPYGETRSYLDIAKLINRPKAMRAVGQACKKNPVGIVVPCHRVIGKDHEMKGYSGKDHINLKIALLEHEKVNILSAYCPNVVFESFIQIMKIRRVTDLKHSL